MLKTGGRHALLSNPPRIAEQVKLFLDQNFLQNPSNAAIAKKFGYHPHYLNQLFLRAFGQTMHAYITSKKISEACRLLLASDASLQAIARQCAFTQSAWFSEAFKQKMGVSPSQYRSQGRR